MKSTTFTKLFMVHLNFEFKYIVFKCKTWKPLGFKTNFKFVSANYEKNTKGIP